MRDSEVETADRQTSADNLHYSARKKQGPARDHSGMLKQKYYRKKANAPYIVGIATGYGGAVDLVMDIIEDVFRETGAYDVKSFFK